jgi:predicted lipid carrier protein YhbT
MQGGVAMADSTANFFDELGRRGHVPLLEKAIGTIRFDLVDGTRAECWLVTVDKGDVSVSRKNVAADCVVRMERTVFDSMMRGDANPMAAYLRGALTFEGDPEFLVLIQRAFPAPASGREPGRGTGSGRDQR